MRRSVHPAALAVRSRVPVMRRWLPQGFLLAATLLPAANVAGQAPVRLDYPPAYRVQVVDTLHGLPIADPYRWMEASERPEVVEWTRRQNELTLPYLASLPGREAFRERMTSLWNFPRVGVPFWRAGRWYYSRNTGLQRQNVWHVRDALDGPEQVVLDPNLLWPEGDVALAGFVPSPDGRYLAYGVSPGGADWRTYVVRNLRTGQLTSDTVRWARFTGLSWTADGNGFFYSRYPQPPAERHLTAGLERHTVYYHRIGTSQDEDIRIYSRPDEPSWIVGAGVDETGRFFQLSSTPGTDRNTLAIVDMGDPLRPDVQAAQIRIAPEADANYWALGVVNGEVFIHTDLDAPNSRVVAVPLATPGREHWRTVVPEGEMPLEWASLVAGRIGVMTLRDVISELRLYGLDGTLERDVPMPGLGTASSLIGRFDRPEIFYVYTDPLQPSTIFMYDAATGESRPFEPPALTFDPQLFRTDRVFYQSRDGTRVPMFITRRRDLPLNGANPTMLYAYGGFGASMTPWFSPDVIAWIEQGGVYAVPAIRGGGEYGRGWHDAGRLDRKQNGFDDFIAAAEYLIRERYTSPGHLAINGGSNGGLLVGAVMTQRPELYAVAVPEVGVLDMLRYHEFTGGGLWGVEYGLPTDSRAFQWLRAYSPLHNIRSGVCYPATLITTADHDDRVVPAHSYKFAGALQAAQSAVPQCHRPILLRVETVASHGYRPLDRRIAERADIWAFAAFHTGMSAGPVP